MQKTLLTILVCGFMVLGLTGCGTNKNEFDIGDKVKTLSFSLTLALKLCEILSINILAQVVKSSSEENSVLI